MTARLLLLLIFMSPAACASPEKLQANWQVVVKPLRSKASVTAPYYWIGLQNNDTAPLAFCRLGVRYEYDLPDGTSVDQPSAEYPEVLSPHPCAPTERHLVLPGETHFVVISIPAAAFATPSGVRVYVVAEATCDRDGPCRLSRRINTPSQSAPR
jgi:hypothetical protein